MKIEVPVPENMVKEAAVKALEYALQNLLAQYELKYKIRIEGIRLMQGYAAGDNTQTGKLANVKIDWQETGSGIRSNEQVRELLEQVAHKEMARITNKLAGNG
ncbi:MAG: hypothetical protein NC548_43105 [Lachnospiraceae bacterium]|nr:hypothetical protein [Lachnospiraceae bacterium]